MNMKLGYKLSSLLAPLLCFVVAGCSQEIPYSQEEETGEGQVELLFNASTGLTTRTTLPGPDNLQHVQNVQLYVFDGTTDASTCVASEDVSWIHAEGAANGLPTREQRYKVKYDGFQPSTTYTFLAVGLDDQSGATYNLPAAIEVGTTTLGNAKAEIASGKGRADIAVSELFAGFSPITTTILGSGTARVDLYRRVAGVMGYFTNIPTKINGTDVAFLRIELYKIQNGSVPLLKQLSNDFIMSPISEVETDKVVVDIPSTEFVADGTTSKGSYVLPIIAPFATIADAAAAGDEYNNVSYVKDYTLCVILADADGNPLRTQKVVNKNTGSSGTDGGTGIIVSTDAYRFPIVANQFYSIGSKDAPVDLGGGEDDIVITVHPEWEGITNIPLE